MSRRRSGIANNKQGAGERHPIAGNTKTTEKGGLSPLAPWFFFYPQESQPLLAFIRFPYSVGVCPVNCLKMRLK